MRKYIHVAKAISPVLTQEAANHIAEEYTRLRNQEQLGTDIARVRKAHTPRVQCVFFLLVGKSSSYVFLLSCSNEFLGLSGSLSPE